MGVIYLIYHLCKVYIKYFLKKVTKQIDQIDQPLYGNPNRQKKTAAEKRQSAAYEISKSPSSCILMFLPYLYASFSAPVIKRTACFMQVTVTHSWEPPYSPSSVHFTGESATKLTDSHRARQNSSPEKSLDAIP